MKHLFLLPLLFAITVLADTPPPGTVKAKTYSGDGATAITATGGSLNVNVTNSTSNTVNQGNAGSQSWLTQITNSSIPVTGTFWQSIQPVSGTLTCNAGSGTQNVSIQNASLAVTGTFFQTTQPVSGTFWQTTQPVSIAALPALATGTNTIGAVNINGTVPISGTITASNTANGNTGSTVPTQATYLGGSNAGSLVGLKASSTGVLSVDASGFAVPVTGTFWQTTQPISGTVTANAGSGTFAISASALPLPAGAATSALQTTGNTSLATIATNSTLQATAAKQPSLGTAGTASTNVITVQGIASMTPLLVNGSGSTQPVSIASLPALATGTNTIGNVNINGTVPISGSITATNSANANTGSAVPTQATFIGGSNSGTLVGLKSSSAGVLSVDASGTTVPVSGTFFQATQPVSASALPLPTGAATSALQSTINTTLGTPFQAGGSIGNTSFIATQATGTNLHTVVDSSALPTGAGTSANQATVIANQTNATQKTQIVDGSGNVIASSGNALNVNATIGSIALPTGASTAALQSVVIGSSAGGTAAASSLLGGGVYNTGTLTLTNGQQAAFQFDVNGNLKTSGGGGGGSNASVGLTGSTAPTSGTLVGGVNASGNLTAETLSVNPAPRATQASVVTPAPQTYFTARFSKVQSGADTALFSTIQTGTGQAVNQSAGNLVMTSGTTVNAETILRSTTKFTGSMLSRIQTILSQRIANNNFYVELVDLIGDGLVTTVNSATSITVTIPSNPFTSVNVGQFIYVGAVQNISSTAVPGRWAIASVSGNNVNFTVAGWPASGSGTVSLFGRNYYQLQYTSTTATAVNYDAQGNGWSSGFTAAAINTTASPGHMAILVNTDGEASFADQLVASNTGLQTTPRASRVVNLGDDTTYYLQLRMANGSVAPASTTTWTVGQASVENYTPVNVAINDIKAQGQGSPMPVSVLGTATISGAVTISSGTVTSTAATVTTNADQASAAITTTTTSAAKVLSAGTSVAFTLNVTASSGSAQTYDWALQTTVDGSNWTTVYQFERLGSVYASTTGVFTTPFLNLQGIQYRYVETLGGTTPSFTRTITSNRSTMPGKDLRLFQDNSQAATSGIFNVEGYSTLTMSALTNTSGGQANLYALDVSSSSDVNAVVWNLGALTFYGPLDGTALLATWTGAAKWARIRTIVNNNITFEYTLAATNGPGASQNLGRARSNAAITNAYATTNITTSAYTQLVAATESQTNLIYIADTSGQAMILATGGSGLEVIVAYIPAGGVPQGLPIQIPEGTRIVYKALSANATTGFLGMTLFN